MPAHRSDAEAEIREAVVDHIRHHRPNARIIHEINAGGGVNRIDVMAVDVAEIISVEIKSEKDKLDRLPSQIETMTKCSHAVFAALHRKFMPEMGTYLIKPRPDGVPYGVGVWYFPKAQDMAEAHHPAYSWDAPGVDVSLSNPLPPDSLHLLHRDELAEMAHDIGIPAPRGANMRFLVKSIRWSGTGRDITRGICRMLRKRTLCAEADPAITEGT